jgi:hypothetical protein
MKMRLGLLIIDIPLSEILTTARKTPQEWQTPAQWVNIFAMIAKLLYIITLFLFSIALFSQSQPESIEVISCITLRKTSNLD